MLKSLAVAAALAIAGTTASAFSLAATNTVVDGGSYDLFEQDQFLFNVSFFDSDGAGSFEFDFTNSGPVDAFAFLSTSINLLNRTIDGGVTVGWVGGPSAVFSGLVSDGEPELMYRIAAGATATLFLSYGDTQTVASPRGPGRRANIDIALTAAPVPVPAAGGLLLAALGGVAVLRRRAK